MLFGFFAVTAALTAMGLIGQVSSAGMIRFAAATESTAMVASPIIPSVNSCWLQELYNIWKILVLQWGLMRSK